MIIKILGGFTKIIRDGRLKKLSIFKHAVFHKEAKVINLQKNKQLITVGDHTHCRGELFIFAHGGKIEIGEYCYIGEYSRIWSACKITIGNRVLISHGVNIHDNNAHPIDAKARHLHFKTIIESNHPTTNLDLQERPVFINDDCWIGFNSTILKGVTIGEGSIIAACSVVTKDVPPYTLVGGNPAKFIKNLKE
jgi:acetyltransferase-like isoleucine patch superfamily enzyme